MANAKRDDNRVPTILGLDTADGETLVRIEADPTSHRLSISNGTSGSDLTGDNAIRDDNGITGLLAVSSADGETPLPVYADSSGNLLTKTT